MKAIFAIVLLAIAVLSATALAQEKTAEDWYKKGIESINGGSSDEAIEAYDRALEINPDYADAWSGKASALASQGKHQEAIAAFDKAIESYDNITGLNPKDADAWYGRGAALDYRAVEMAFDNSSTKERNEYREEAVKAFDRAIEINPQYAMAWKLKGAVLHLMGRYEDAAKAFDEALVIDPKLQGAQEGKGLALAALGMQSDSARSYDEVLDSSNEEIKMAITSGNLSEAWLSKGFLLQEQGKYEDAVKALDNATDADPNSETAWKVKGVILSRELKRYEDAVEAFDRAIQINPDDPRTWQNKGDALRALSRNSEADTAFAKANDTGRCRQT
ncbi:MAG TPA: tetratricopeptide repeat protein [Methanotrichaceae archaeon]|nr:tetratricopeptide repeat protein [Methanotrichaceae archaeon]